MFKDGDRGWFCVECAPYKRKLYTQAQVDMLTDVIAGLNQKVALLEEHIQYAPGGEGALRALKELRMLCAPKPCTY